MAHNVSTGLTDNSNIKELQIALQSGKQSDFDDLNKSGDRKQVSPQSALSIELSGADPEGVTIPACFALNSRKAAAEMIELYEKCILRNTSFSVISGESLGSAQEESDLTRAVDNLNLFNEDFEGAKEGSFVTRKTLFRGVGEKETVGPYVSQFLLLDVNIGSHVVNQLGLTKTGVYGITESNWLEIQNGNIPIPQTTSSDKKYIFNPAQLASFVFDDLIYQSFLYCAAILLDKNASTNSAFPEQPKEIAFATNGGIAEIVTSIAEVSRHALKAAWVQKWRKHLRLRPEAMAARVVKEEDGIIDAGTVHPDIFTVGTSTISAVKSFNIISGGEGKAWLPLQYAEGSPAHPSFPSAHSVVAGACATLLKIYFEDKSWSFLGENPVQSLDGNSLTAYDNPDSNSMTIHGEINKLASNVSIGRSFAGVNFRSDCDKGLKLGEKVAIQYFKDLRNMQNEDIEAVTIMQFDGIPIVI
jgi:hypothetical protein